MTSKLPPYDDGLTLASPRAMGFIQPWHHGPIFITRRWPIPLQRAWCAECKTWVGPDRTGDPQSMRLVEDDAIAHAHQVGVLCGLCEACRPDGAIAMANAEQAARNEWNRTEALQ